MKEKQDKMQIETFKILFCFSKTDLSFSDLDLEEFIPDKQERKHWIKYNISQGWIENLSPIHYSLELTPKCKTFLESNFKFLYYRRNRKLFP